MVSEPITIFIIGQAITILIVLIGGFIRLNNKLTTISGDVVQLKTQRSEQREDHVTLRGQVQGISRTVERHDAILKERAG